MVCMAEKIEFSKYVKWKITDIDFLMEWQLIYRFFNEVVKVC